ncbi:unnamed protein product [Urochloa humidicola]
MVVDLMMRNLPRRQEPASHPVILPCRSIRLGAGNFSYGLCLNHSSKQQPRVHYFQSMSSCRLESCNGEPAYKRTARYEQHLHTVEGDE